MKYRWIRGENKKSLAEYSAELDDTPTTPGAMAWIPCTACGPKKRLRCEVCDGTGQMLTTLREGSRVV